MTQRRLGDSAETAAVDPEFRRERIHASLIELLRPVVTEPTVLVVEDMHWCDEASASLLAALAVADLPIRLLVTRRPGSTPFELAEDVAERVVQVPVRPLDASRTRKLIRSWAGGRPLAPADVDVVVARADGNPLFARAMVGELIEGRSIDAVPLQLEQLLQARLGRQSADDRLLLSVAAVIGQRVDVSLLGSLVEQSEDQVRSRLRHLPDVIELVAPDARFVHALVRDAAYDTLPFRKRERIHAAIADELASRPHPPVELLAIHNLRAHRFRLAGEQLVVATQRALDVFAIDEALRFCADSILALRRGGAVHDPARRELLLEQVVIAADLHRRAGRMDAGLAFCSRWGRADLPPDVRARLRLHRARLLGDLGRYGASLRSRATVISNLDVDPVIRAQAAIDQVATLRQVPRTSAALALLDRVSDTLSFTEVQRQHLGFQRALALGEAGDPGAIEATRAALQSTTDRRLRAQLHNNLGVELYYLGRWGEATAAYAEAVDELEAVGDRLEMALARNNLGEIALDQGRQDDAGAALQDSFDVFLAARRANGIRLSGCSLARLQVRLGDLSAASSTIALVRSQLGGSVFNLSELDGAECELLLADGRPAEAVLLSAAAIRAATARLTPGAVVARLHRLHSRGLQPTDQAGAINDLIASIGVARRHDAAFEAALSVIALARLDPGRIAGADVDAAGQVLDRLEVHTDVRTA